MEARWNMNLKKHANEEPLQLASSWDFILKAVGSHWKVYSKVGFWPVAGGRVRKRYGRGQGTNSEPTAGIQVQNDKVTLPCPHLHAYSYVGFSTPCVISIWKMLFLPLQRVTVLVIITNIYVSDTSTPFTGHEWCNPQNSPVRTVLSLSPFYSEKKEQGSHKANGWQKLAWVCFWPICSHYCLQ